MYLLLISRRNWPSSGLALGTCNAVTKKKTERAEPWRLCSIVLVGWGRFSSSRAFQPLCLTVSDVIAAAIAAATAAAFVAAGVVVVAAAATATIFVAAAVAVVAAAGVVVVVVAEGAAVLLAIVVASAVVVVAADAGVGVKGVQWGGNRMKDGRNEPQPSVVVRFMMHWMGLPIPGSPLVFPPPIPSLISPIFPIPPVKYKPAHIPLERGGAGVACGLFCTSRGVGG